jgi:zinc transport system permease protein
MLYIGISPTLAAAHRVRVRFYQYVFAALLSVVVIFSVWAVGVFLVTAMLIVPAATARNLARSASSLFWWALVVSVTSAVAGLILSAQPWANTATGPTVILCSSAWFFVSAVAATNRTTSTLPPHPDARQTQSATGYRSSHKSKPARCERVTAAASWFPCGLSP